MGKDSVIAFSVNIQNFFFCSQMNRRLFQLELICGTLGLSHLTIIQGIMPKDCLNARPRGALVLSIVAVCPTHI
jgi:hypothetical protein